MKENVRICLEQQPLRAQRSLEREAAAPPTRGRVEGIWHKLFPFALKRDPSNGNQTLRRLAVWFQNPVEGHCMIRGECDFVALKLCRFWHLFPGKDLIEPQTWEEMRRFFLENDFSSVYQSENHALIFHTARYLMAHQLSSETFTAYGKTGAQLWPLEEEWLTHYLRHRARRGWGEFDSTVYMCPDWECLCALFDYAPSLALHELVEKMMNVLLADMAVDSLRGMYGGAHGRIYPNEALDHGCEPTRVLQYLYFGLFEPEKATEHNFLLDASVCAFVPHPAVVDIALNRSATYENRERKHLHNVADVLPLEPLEGSIRKYTFWTPDYVMGAVQFQDAYPENPRRVCDCSSSPLVALHGKVLLEQSEIREYAHHQQHQWDLTFPANPRARVFTHHPGQDGTHNYWTGDRLCGCGHFFQNRTALVALYDIAADQPLQWIHAYVPKRAFDECVERDNVIFIRSGQSAAALRLLPDYQWTVEGEWKDCEVISMGARHGVVCEVGELAAFGGFSNFQDEILSNRVEFSQQELSLRYESKRAGRLEIDAHGLRQLNGSAIDLNYATYDCPFLRSEWCSGLIRLVTSEAEEVTFDFTNLNKSQ